MENTEGVLTRFERLREKWDDITADERQALMDHWNVILNMEDLKEAGLVDGEAGVDVPVVRMMFGYGLGRGVKPCEDTEVIAEHVEMLRAK